MNISSKQQEKLIELLRELFQLNQPDLDFGLYRIMHAKSQEIEQFLNEDLLATIQQRLGGNKAEKVEKAKAAYERERQNAIDYGGNPDTAPKAMQAHADYKAAQESQDDDEDLYEQLYRFFERYYDGGDFLSRRYYGRETSEKGAPYAVPYDGSEVYLHWANKDQYYIKTTENFRQFSVDLAQAKLNAAELFSSQAPGKLHFTLVEAEEGVHNNVKAANDKERYFIVDADAPLDWQGDELTVRFHYRADEDKPAKGRNWREERNKRNEAAILAALEEQAAEKGEQAGRAQRYHQALNADIPKGKDGTQKLIAKYLNQYTAKNSMDYFIHKDLGGFLKRELDYYIKNELFRLDELGSEKQPNTKNYERHLQKALTLREVAHKLIEFLAQTEEFQKKLWLKKKFVVDTQWLITLDKAPAELYSQIEANDAQWSEWEKLGFMPAKAKRKELLKPDSKLVLDTQFFDADFTAKLLEHIGNTAGHLDEATDGVLVHSENLQALNLMQERYRGQVNCVCIDPPYNTGSDGFCYKDGYKSSTWLTQQHQTLPLARASLSETGSFLAFCDENEVRHFGLFLEEIFGEPNFVETIIWNKRVPKNDKGIGNIHDFVFLLAKDLGCRRSHGLEYKMRKDELDEIYEIVRKARAAGKNQSEAQLELKKFYKKQGYDRGLTLYCELDENFEIWGKINMSWPNAKTEGPRYEVINPVTKVACPIPDNGWRWKEETFRAAERDGPTYLLPDGSMMVGRIWYSPKSTIQPSSVTYLKDVESFLLRSILSVKSDGSVTLDDLGMSGRFDYPKSVLLIERLLYSIDEDHGLISDYFGGSGSTGHSIINLNREDNGKRKYLLVEMGDYFDTVLKPRIAKVIYSADWKDGKPTAPETGISQLVKIVRLESYEDTLSNLYVKEESSQSKVIAMNPDLREDYFLHYLLELETQGSPSLLNVAQFSDPTAYTLRVKQPGSDAQAHRTVDLVETFNWLLGLRVSKLFAPQVFAARFAEERDAELGMDAEPRQVLKAPLSLVKAGKNGWWFRTVQGLDADGHVVWVVWRKLTSDPVQDNLVLEAYLREQLGFDVCNPDGTPCAQLYVNGSHALPNVAHCEVRQLEEAFHRLMWDMTDV